MSYKKFCDKCGQEIKENNYVRIEYVEDKILIYKDFHIDCFNWQFSCDIRKIKESEDL